MSTTRKHRGHRNPSQWKILIEEYQSSGQTLKAFCMAKGINAKYFSSKRRNLGYPTLSHSVKATSPPTSSSFIPIQVTHQSSTSLDQLELVFNGVKLKLPATLSPHWLSQLLRELS